MGCFCNIDFLIFFRSFDWFYCLLLSVNFSYLLFLMHIYLFLIYFPNWCLFFYKQTQSGFNRIFLSVGTHHNHKTNSFIADYSQTDENNFSSSLFNSSFWDCAQTWMSVRSLQVCVWLESVWTRRAATGVCVPLDTEAAASRTVAKVTPNSCCWFVEMFLVVSTYYLLMNIYNIYNWRWFAWKL